MPTDIALTSGGQLAVIISLGISMLAIIGVLVVCAIEDVDAGFDPD